MNEKDLLGVRCVPNPVLSTQDANAKLRLSLPSMNLRSNKRMVARKGSWAFLNDSRVKDD